MELTNYPLVSVIIPAHNVEDYLEACVKSIQLGTYRNIEIVLVENGSIDSTGAICDSLALDDNRISVFHSDSIGVSSARNYGINNSQGDYVCFVDADDLVSKDYIQYLVSLILKEKVNIALSTNIVTFYGSENDVENVTQEEIVERTDNSEEALEEILLYKMTVVSCFSKIFKRSFLIKRNIKFIDNLFIGEGFNFNVLAFNNTNTIAFSNKPIYFYRINNPNSAMTKVNVNKIFNGLLALNYLEKTLKQRSNRIEKALNYAKWHTNFDFLMTMLSGKNIGSNEELFNNLVLETKKGRQVSKSLPISLKEKLKANCASLSPVLAGRLFNRLRRRKMSE